MKRAERKASLFSHILPFIVTPMLLLVSIAGTSVDADDAVPLSDPCAGQWACADAPESGGFGEAVVGTCSHVYLIECSNASSTPAFWRYDPVSDAWEERGITLCGSSDELPAGQFRNGTALVWDNGDYLYALAGARYSDADRRDFLRYSISDDCWELVDDTPCAQGAGDAISWSGSDNCLYAILGSVEHGSCFARYCLAGESWEPLGDPPGRTDDGCSLAWAGGSDLFALQGEYFEMQPNNDFWHYDIDGDVWTAVAPIPDGGGVGDGGSMIWFGNWLPAYKDSIYALGGASCEEDPGYGFYTYSVANDSWTECDDVESPVGYYNGQRLAFSGGGLYFWQGSPRSFQNGGDEFCTIEVGALVAVERDAEDGCADWIDNDCNGLNDGDDPACCFIDTLLGM